MALLSERIQEGRERGKRGKTITNYMNCFVLGRWENQLISQVENLSVFSPSKYLLMEILSGLLFLAIFLCYIVH